jgi:hypothetical protein
MKTTARIQNVLRDVLLCLCLCCALAINLRAQAAQTIAFTNGRWYDGKSFQKKTGYSVLGWLTFRRPSHVDRTIDLQGGYVIPPFGEAHNHNVETLNNVDKLIAKYLQHGIFYIKNPNSLARDREALRPKLNRPDSIDVVFSNGSFTATGGHPVEIPERVIRTGKWTADDAEGGFYYTVNDAAELEQKWPALLGTHPDFIKTYLLYSDEYRRRRDDPRFFAWKGLDPNLLPLIVNKAHTAGLRVSTHIEDAADFHAALMAGVDEINHMPGFRRFSDVEKHPASAFEISDADAKRAALQGTCVVTTLGGARALAPDQKREQDDFNMRNLWMLLRHHVKLALGSDSYGEDTIPEAIYISSLHAMDNRTLLKLWTTSTAQTIFPGRKIGKLQQAYEANFLVLRANPLDNFEAVQDIAVAVKQGVVLELTRSSKPAPQSGAICGNYSAGASVWPSCDHENIWESLK